VLVVAKIFILKSGARILLSRYFRGKIFYLYFFSSHDGMRYDRIRRNDVKRIVLCMGILFFCHYLLLKTTSSEINFRIYIWAVIEKAFED
jgi:hypothetical protein